jgi:hypothetical protein
MTLNTLFTLLLPAAIAMAAGPLNALPAKACSGLHRQSGTPKLSRLFHHRFYGSYGYPFGEDLRLTIHSAAEQVPPSGASKSGERQALDTVGSMFAVLRSCWVPPDEEKAHPGMEMTVRFALKRNGEMIAPPRVTYSTRGATPETREVYLNAIMSALQRCTPLPLNEELASEIAGVPIAVQFVDDRKLP